MTALRRLIVMLVAASCAVVMAAPQSAEAVSIATGDIIVADPGAGQILKIDPRSGAQSSLTAKIANAVTTRSNVFAIWITLGTLDVQGTDGSGSDTTISSGVLLEDPEYSQAIRERFLSKVTKKNCIVTAGKTKRTKIVHIK